MTILPLNNMLIEPLVRAALLEDLGHAGDITTDRIVPADLTSKAKLVARQPGRIAGLGIAESAFRQLDPNIVFTPQVKDGAAVKAKAVLATIEGNARAILTGERTALNFLCHLSGIATETARLSALIPKNKPARIADTRKTTPGLRALEKYAVTCGGGMNHRFGLDDCILIKDNHIAVAGSVKDAIRLVRQDLGHTVKIEVEVDTLEQLAEVMASGRVDAVLLDNMKPDMLREAVLFINGRATIEASGNITADTIAAIAASGVDVISVGGITHSAPVLDIALDF
jgi:nicotinate-nucleotide pyrophosphorylase (carboxylating)